MKTRIQSLMVALAFAMANVLAPAGTVSSPVGGTEVGSWPFYFPTNEGSSARSQQVHGAADFRWTETDQIYISAISLRGSAGEVLPQFQLNLSTTAREPDSLSPVFAENVGPDDTAVFGPGPLSFQLIEYFPSILFSRRFLYDRTRGNLLVDIRNFEGVVPRWYEDIGFVYAASGFDRVSGVAGLDVLAQSGNAGTGGYVFIFWYEPVPEPGVTTLLLAGLGAFVGVATWRRSQKRPGFSRTRRAES